MKRNIIIAAIAMMAIVPSASAQEQIKKAFQEVTDELAGVTKVGEQKTAKVDKDGITVESNVTTIKVERRYQHSVSETLRDAFRKEATKASMYEEETGSVNTGIDSALVHDLGLRRQWSIYRDGAESVLIGSMKNSCYYIANFNDKKHKGYRTCYAAEWSNAANSEVYTVKLVYVYGQQPPGSPGIAKVDDPLDIDIMGVAVRPDFLGEDIEDWSLNADSLLTRMLKNKKNIGFGSFTLNNSQNVPFDGNTETWMALVMQRGVSNLSNGDWHRFFGLLTQKMMDPKYKDAKEDMVVSAGIILDLCKNAPLDDDERSVAANRLLQVSERFDSDNTRYIFDMLELARKKVEKK